MKNSRLCGVMLGVAQCLILTGCFTRETRPVVPPTAPPVDIQPTPPAADVVPHLEPRSRSGNPPFYDVFGKRYYVLSSSVGYVERGVASWYGPGFHKVRTSTGETYDMYGMTAAHKTLPLPAYVSVTNLQNGRSIVVRVNDRGPFVGNRIIDLSYTAASKLDMLKNGTAMVEVRSIDSPSPAVTVPAAEEQSPTAAAPVVNAPLFVQAGAFSDPANAERLAERLRGGHYGTVFVRDNEIAGRRMYRVLIGPVPDVAEFDRIVSALDHLGIKDAHLALD